MTIEHSAGTQPISVTSQNSLISLTSTVVEASPGRGSRRFLGTTVRVGEPEQMTRNPQPIGEPLENVQSDHSPSSALQLTDVRLRNADQHADVTLASARPFPEDTHHRTHVAVRE